MFFLDLPCYPLDSPMFFLCFLMIFPWVPPEKTQGWNFQVRLWLGGHWAAGHHRFPAARSQRDHLPWCLLAVQEPTRNMFGICVAYLWHIYGIFMIYLWYLNEIWKPPGHILEYWSSEWHMVDECRWMDASWRSKPGHLGIMSVKLCHKPAMTGNGTVDTTYKNGDDWGIWCLEARYTRAGIATCLSPKIYNIWIQYECGDIRGILLEYWY